MRLLHEEVGRHGMKAWVVAKLKAIHTIVEVLYV
jgi:hypothetical protein